MIAINDVALIKLVNAGIDSANDFVPPLQKGDGLVEQRRRVSVSPASERCRNKLLIVSGDTNVHDLVCSWGHDLCGILYHIPVLKTRSFTATRLSAPANLAITAMAQWQLNRRDEARATLARLRALMKDPDWADDEDAKALTAEAEALIEGQARDALTQPAASQATAEPPASQSAASQPSPGMRQP